MSEIGDVQLGHRLMQLRERAGMKQAELARRVTWSPAVLSRVETGERTVSDEELGALLGAMGTPEASELATIVTRRWNYLPRPALGHPDHSLLWEAEQMTAALEAAHDAPGARPAFQRRLREYIDELRHLSALLLRQEHQIAFIGSIGIGKSTAICRATGLETPGQHGRPVPVLETGAGGITLCEVHLTVGPGFGIIVEPRSHDDIRSDVEDFIDQILQAGQAAAVDDEGVSVPRELERAIRNMTGLAPKRTKSADGKTARVDPAKNLAAEISSRRDLVVEILTRMSLHRRDRRDEWYSPALAADPLEWMKSRFEQVNNGRHPEFSLPSRIDLIVPRLVPIEGLEVSIIDTRGIDQPAARADLEALLEDPHTLSVLCSGFNDAPSQALQHLLQRARDINNPQIDTNVAMLVLPRPGEALEVKDETGMRVESAAEGCELKGEQIGGQLIRYKLSELPVSFFNAFEDEPDLLREFLQERLAYTRSEFGNQVRQVLDRTRLLLDNAEREQVQEVQREAGRHLASWIKQNRTPIAIRGHVHDTLLDEIQMAHAATVHAAVRRDGEWRSLSYSHQLAYGARKLAVTALQRSVSGFTTLCATLQDSTPEAAELLSQAQALMTAAYDDLLRKVQLTGLTLYQDQLRKDPQFWLENASEWGQGAGYRNRVLRRNRSWFEEAERYELEVHLEGVLNREWVALLQRVESIFEVA